MTDTTHRDADALASRLTELMEQADARERSLSATLAGVDGDGEEDRTILAALLQDAMQALEDVRAESERLADDLGALRGDAMDLAADCEDAYLESQATSDLATLALDVERGIRDHSELIDACRALSSNYVFS